MDEILKGNIYYANLNPVIGSEQGGNRPVLVLQNNIGNKYSPTVLVAPITNTKNFKSNIPTHINIRAFGKLKYDSTILLEQIRVIDKTRLKSFLGNLEDKKIIDKKLLIAFGIKKGILK